MVEPSAGSDRAVDRPLYGLDGENSREKAPNVVKIATLFFARTPATVCDVCARSPRTVTASVNRARALKSGSADCNAEDPPPPPLDHDPSPSHALGSPLRDPLDYLRLPFLNSCRSMAFPIDS